MAFLTIHRNHFVRLAVLTGVSMGAISPILAHRGENEMGRVGDRTVSSQYDLLRALNHQLKDFSPEHRSIVQTLIQLHGFEIVPKIFDHVLAMKRYDVRDQKKDIARQFAFLAAYKTKASEEQWEALKLLIQLYGFDPVHHALRSQEDEQKESSLKTQQKGNK